MAGEKPGEDRVLAGGATYIDFQTDPQRYRHWKLAVDGDTAATSARSYRPVAAPGLHDGGLKNPNVGGPGLMPPGGRAGSG